MILVKQKKTGPKENIREPVIFIRKFSYEKMPRARIQGTIANDVC